MSDLSMEMDRLAAVDVHNTFSASKESIGTIGNSLRQLGLINDEQYKWVTMANSALGVIVGMAGIAKLAQAWQERKKITEDAKAVALTAANSWNPEGWAKIAAAGAVAAAAGVAMYAAINTIRLGEFDLSTAAGQQAANQAVQGAIE